MTENEMEKMIEEALGITRDLQNEDGEVCVVSHPDAGGPCGRPATRLVWELPFCEIHGAEAEAAALEELAEALDEELGILAAAESNRTLDNPVLVELLRQIGGTVQGAGEDYVDRTRIRDEARARAFPLIPGRVSPDTLAFDYDSHYPGSGPVEWWSERLWLLRRFMRQAGEWRLPGLVRELEPLRERASAQLVQAEADFERRYVAPRRAEKAAGR